MADMKLVKQFAATMKEANKRTEPYDTPAEVVRIEGNTAWVHIPGGVDETPVQLTVNAEEGDTVQVRVGGGSAWITGNATAPPTDDRGAIVAQATAEEALRAAGYYISSDGTGVMIADMKEGGRETPSTATKKNVRIDDDSVDVRDGQTVLASFGETVRLGEDVAAHLELDYHSLQLIDRDNNAFFHVSDLRNADGIAEIVDTFTGDGSTRTFYLSISATSTDYTVNVSDSSGGAVTKSTTYVSFSTAPADGATITVTYTSTSSLLKYYTLGKRADNSKRGSYSLAEGYNNTASGSESHAEGYGTTASGSYSHAEGSLTTASKSGSHAEGFSTQAIGSVSHAEGASTIAHGSGSHAQNDGTVAWSDYQTTLGRYNVIDYSDTYAVIIGNGTDDNDRSNALAVGWDGSIEAALFKTATYTYSYSNLAAGATILVTGSDLGVSTPTGYAPIGFVTCHSGLRYVDVIWMDATATGSNNVIVLYNHSTSARTGTATVTILYARTGLIT